MYDERPSLETRTKIVATLGPACWDEPNLTQILEAGVDVARINCSHADHESIRRQVARVRRAAMRLGKPTAILLDLQGPKIRTGKVPEPLPLAEGDILTVIMDEDYVGKGLKVGTTYPQMVDDVTVDFAGSIESNTASGDGGGIGLRGGVFACVAPGDVHFNFAQNGAGMALWDGSATLTACEVSTNQATVAGGGVWLIDGELVSDATDWGSLAGLANTPDTVHVDALGTSYAYFVPADFRCDATGCR